MTTRKSKSRRSTREIVERAIKLSKTAVGTWDDIVRNRPHTASYLGDEDITAEEFKRVLEKVSRPTKNA